MSEIKEAGHSLFHEGGLVESAGSSRRRVTIAIRSPGDQRCAKGTEKAGQYLWTVTLFPHMTTSPQLFVVSVS
jgi:hypothetical protein